MSDLELTYQIGDLVKIKKLGNKHGKIIQIRKNQKFVILADNIQIECTAIDLILVSENKVKKIDPNKVKSKIVKNTSARNIPSLDLHGKTAAVAKELILDFLSTMVMAGHTEVHIIHGKGSGILQTCCENTLKESGVVKRALINKTNSGYTRVYL